MTFLEFCCAVRTLRRIYGFSVTSWGRTVTHNHKLGGKVNSWHLDDMAVDGVLDRGSDLPGLKLAGAALLLDVVVEDDHVHLEPSGPR